MEKLDRNLNKLKLLSCCSKKIKDNCINKCNRELIKTIEECVLNTLNGNIFFSKKDKNKLVKYKYSLRKLLKEKSQKNKKKILIQQGGFLQILLPSAITLITELLNRIQQK